jgi:hypothetical protein
VKTIRYKKINFIVFLFLSFSNYGCFGVNGDFKDLRNEIFKTLNAEEVDKEFEYSASNFEVYLASKIASMSDRMIEAEIALEKISNVQIGVYNVRENELPSPNIIFHLDKKMREKGWSNLIKSCNHKEGCFVYINLENKDRIKNAFLLNIDSEEIVIIEIHGKLDNLVEQIIKKRGIRI